MDLHAWITERVDEAMKAAPHWVGCTSLPAGIAAPEYDHFSPEDCNCSAPAATIRRCEGDRRILARHNVDPARADDWQDATNCQGCGVSGYLDLPDTENLNDCPELLDLAYAHGITEAELAGLDRPQPPERKPLSERYANGGILTAPIQTSDVPAALRGPNWTSRP